MKPADKRQQRIAALCDALPALTDGQLEWVRVVAKQFSSIHEYTRSDDSDIMSPCVLQDFGDALRIHHCFSHEAFSKDKFEYVLERVLTLCNMPASLATRGNRGHDITIEGVPVSLKTQANRGLNKALIHISKFMELGKGQWGTDDSDLFGLRDQFLEHMKGYDRLLVLRNLSKAPLDWNYDLVEIPKSLLLLAATVPLEMQHNSTQIPRPGYGRVFDADGNLSLELYFDGGGERKLQIRKIRVSLCHVHASWRFPPIDLQSEG